MSSEEKDKFGSGLEEEALLLIPTAIITIIAPIIAALFLIFF